MSLGGQEVQRPMSLRDLLIAVAGRACAAPTPLASQGPRQRPSDRQPVVSRRKRLRLAPPAVTEQTVFVADGVIRAVALGL